MEDTELTSLIHLYIYQKDGLQSALSSALSHKGITTTHFKIYLFCAQILHYYQVKFVSG